MHTVAPVDGPLVAHTEATILEMAARDNARFIHRDPHRDVLATGR